MLIITVAVGLLPLVSTTVDAASYDIPYVVAITDADGVTKVYASDGQCVVLASRSNTTTQRNIADFGIINATYVLELVYSPDLLDWVVKSINFPAPLDSTIYRFGTSVKYTVDTPFFDIADPVASTTPYADYSIITNSPLNSSEISAFGSYSDDLSLLPHGLTTGEVRDIIDEQLNTTTASGQTAQTIINNTTNQYNLYLSGDIDSTTMQQNVKSNIDTLSDLTPSTLLDAMQINNGLTYNQTIQDQLLNTASGTVQSSINQYINNINTAVSNYQSGDVSQADTVTIIHQQINALNNLITSGSATTTADINAVNAAINTANANLDSVTGYQDVSQDSSDKSQASDQAELDYLDELTAETTATVEQLAPSKNFTSTQTGEAQQVLELIWENEFVKRLLPMCAGFMVVCVVLGVKYKV